MVCYYYTGMFLQEVYASEAIAWIKEDFVNNDTILSLYNEVGVANLLYLICTVTASRIVGMFE